MLHDDRHGERGVALITALLSTLILLALGLALLSVVDVQATESAAERTRDRNFNLSESVLTSEAFVMGRSWPEQAGGGLPVCSAAGAGFNDAVGAATGSSAAAERLRKNLTQGFAADPAYAGATWQVNLCDDSPPATVWTQALLNNPNYDANGNDRMWVRAQSMVAGKQRVVVGLVRVRRTPVLNSRYALTAGSLADDLGASVDTLTNDVLGGVLGGPNGLLRRTPTVAPDPLAAAPRPNGVTGVRCGLLDLSAGSTCLSGTLAAAGALPVLSSVIGGTTETLSGTTATSEENIGRLRAQAKASGTYTATSPGTPPGVSTNLLNGADTGGANAVSCQITGTPNADRIAFIEQVGTAGTSNTTGGPGDQYCALDVSTAKTYKAIVVASGRIIIRGNSTTTAASNTAVNTFSGVVYALNLQRLPVADGGRGLGDTATPGREIVRIDRGAHVKGGVNADGKSGKVGVYPPPIQINQTALIESLVPCIRVLGLRVCTAQNLVKALLGDTTAVLNELVSLVGLSAVTDAVLGQADPQRVSYGSAITTDVAAINALTVYGASAVLPGTFRDLAGR